MVIYLACLMGVLAYLVGFLFFTYCWWRIVGKMGFNTVERLALTIGLFVPVIGATFIIFYLALFDWPIHKDYEKLKHR